MGRRAIFPTSMEVSHVNKLISECKARICKAVRMFRDYIQITESVVAPVKKVCYLRSRSTLFVEMYGWYTETKKSREERLFEQRVPGKRTIPDYRRELVVVTN
mmetsp:Transcript_22108/g.57682  ORF Transcript_22108/g.57682 Transcript_22108/m.57682 type:complete len:103 (+) Transcript_22108:567-875(+)